MSNALMKLIDDYAAWSAQSLWQDDQGYVWEADTARKNKEAARKAVVDAVATLQAGRAMINSAFCNLQDVNDKLKAENERLSTELEKAQDETLALALEALEECAEVMNKAADRVVKDAILADALYAQADLTHDAITAIKQAQQAEPQIHCSEKLKKGGCQLHNLHCGWPKCNTAPTLPTLPAPKQAKPAECKCCYGTGRIVRDPDIGTDQECFCCNGEGVVND